MLPSGFELEPSPSPKYTLFSKGIHICLMKSLTIMFPVWPIWFKGPILEMLSSNPVPLSRLVFYSKQQTWVFFIRPKTSCTFEKFLPQKVYKAPSLFKPLTEKLLCHMLVSATKQWALDNEYIWPQMNHLYTSKFGNSHKITETNDCLDIICSWILMKQSFLQGL